MNSIVIDLPEAQMQALAALVQVQGRPRTALIREAIDAYLAQQRPSDQGVNVFGMWKNKKPDGLSYQEELRSKW